jgi:hypothetical protein
MPVDQLIFDILLGTTILLFVYWIAAGKSDVWSGPEIHRHWELDDSDLEEPPLKDKEQGEDA